MNTHKTYGKQSVREMTRGLSQQEDDERFFERRFTFGQIFHDGENFSKSLKLWNFDIRKRGKFSLDSSLMCFASTRTRW